MFAYLSVAFLVAILSTLLTAAFLSAGYGSPAALSNAQWRPGWLNIDLKSKGRGDLLVGINGLPAGILRFTSDGESIGTAFYLPGYVAAGKNSVDLRPLDGEKGIFGTIRISEVKRKDGHIIYRTILRRTLRNVVPTGGVLHCRITFDGPLGAQSAFGACTPIGKLAGADRRFIRQQVGGLLRALKDGSPVPIFWAKDKRVMEKIHNFVNKYKVIRVAADKDIEIYHFQRGLLVCARFPGGGLATCRMRNEPHGISGSGITFGLSTLAIGKIRGRWIDLSAFTK